ncbi:MAG: hypothetical protein ACSLFB_00320 [Acidimicrobiales bacterium]
MSGILSSIKTNKSKRLRVVGVGILGLLAGLLPMEMTASAAVTSITLSTSSVAESPDYAGEVMSDSWDFSNQEDFWTIDKVASGGTTNMSINGGLLSLDANAGGWLTLAGAQVTGHVPLDRDLSYFPIDPARYNRVSFRMFSNVEGPAGVFWYNCPTLFPECQGGFPFLAKVGWHSYDFPMTPGFAAAAQPWSGNITGLRLIPMGASAAHIALDWVRLHQSQTPVTLTVAANASSALSVYWDADKDMGNNNADNPGWGLVTSIASPTGSNAVSFPAAAYPQGSYSFYATQDGATSGYSAALTINGRPQPVVINPDRKGGADYATIIRGDAWDFAQGTDVSSLTNAYGTVNGTSLDATSYGPNANDSMVWLPVPTPIEGSRFHRLTFRAGFDGPFSLEDAPGGGMNARVIWANASAPGSWQDSDDFLVFPGWREYTIEMATNPPTAINEPNRPNNLGWAGQQITDLRWDPHEDPGGRAFSIDDIRLAEDDKGIGSYPIEFQDNNWEPGTKADIYIDSDNNNFNGTKIASNVSVTAGINTYTWTGTNVPPGRYWVYIVMKDGASEDGAYSTGPVQMSPTETDVYKGFMGGATVASGDLNGDGREESITGAGPGGGPHVRTFDSAGNPGHGFFAYDPGFRGGVHVASGDINGDGVDEIITGAGAGGGPHIRIFSGGGEDLGGFFAFDPAFNGGVTVATADVDGNGVDEIIVGAGPGGGPHVRVFRRDGSEINGFFPFPEGFRGGVNVAGGDLDGDGDGDIIVGAGPGGGPHVRGLTIAGGDLLSFYAYPEGFTGGVHVGAGDFDNDGLDDIITGAGAGGGAHVIVHVTNGGKAGAFPYSHAGGVRVAAGDGDGDGRAEALTMPGPGTEPYLYRYRPF